MEVCQEAAVATDYYSKLVSSSQKCISKTQILSTSLQEPTSTSQWRQTSNAQRPCLLLHFHQPQAILLPSILYLSNKSSNFSTCHHLTPTSTCSPADTPALYCLNSPSVHISSSPVLFPLCHFVMLCTLSAPVSAFLFLIFHLISDPQCFDLLPVYGLPTLSL